VQVRDVVITTQKITMFEQCTDFMNWAPQLGKLARSCHFLPVAGSGTFWNFSSPGFQHVVTVKTPSTKPSTTTITPSTAPTPPTTRTPLTPPRTTMTMTMTATTATTTTTKRAFYLLSHV
jgi:hypothetical protein